MKYLWKHQLIALFFLLIFPATLLSADKKSAPKVEAPKWIQSGADIKYPAMLYLSAVGEGDSLKEAEIAARRNLSTIFEAKVNSTLTSEQTETMKASSDGSMSGEQNRAIRKNTVITTNITLYGAFTGAQYVDEARNRFYVLAVLNKLNAATLYDNKIKAIDEKMQALAQSFDSTQKIGVGQDLLKLYDERERLNAYVMVLQGMPAGPCPVSYAEIQKILDKGSLVNQARSIFFEYDSGSWDTAVRDRITQALTERGVTFLTGPESQAVASFRLKGQLKATQEYQNIPGWLKYRFVNSIVIEKGDLVVGRITKEKIETGRAKEQCLSKSIDPLTEGVADEILKQLNQN